MKNETGIGEIVKRTFKGWWDDDPFRQSAIIAYYSIFSLPALLVLIINIIGFFFTKEAMNAEITRQVSGVMGAETAETITKIIANANQTKAGLIPSIIAIGVLISGATGVFVQLQVALNEIWGVKQKSSGGIGLTIRNRLFSFGLILTIGFLLLVSLVLSSLLASVSHWLESAVAPGLAYLMYAVEFVVSLGVIATLFALMFRYLPDVRTPWKHVWVGAAVTAVLFVAGKYGLSFYFGKSNPGSVYGAAGSIILVLLWVSYSSMIVFFGAEFTRQFAFARHARMVLTKNAEVVDPEADGKIKTAQDIEEREHPLGRRELPKLKSAAALEREADKLSLQAVVRKIQIKEMIANMFKFRKHHQHA